MFWLGKMDVFLLLYLSRPNAAATYSYTNERTHEEKKWRREEVCVRMCV